ncbi:MAG: hypothetical protein M1399_07350 [Actinobacteria bacterium]|nr:hypothetical protein [Actinomycetota bacterium]
MAVPLDDQLIDVGRLDGIQGSECKIVDADELDADELAHLGFIASVQSRDSQALVQSAGTLEDDRDASATGDVTESRGKKRLADADRSRDESVANLLDETERHELAPDTMVVGDRCALIPCLQDNVGSRCAAFTRAEAEAVSRRDSSSEKIGDPVHSLPSRRWRMLRVV